MPARTYQAWDITGTTEVPCEKIAAEPAVELKFIGGRLHQRWSVQYGYFEYECGERTIAHIKETEYEWRAVEEAD